MIALLIGIGWLAGAFWLGICLAKWLHRRLQGYPTVEGYTRWGAPAQSQWSEGASARLMAELQRANQVLDEAEREIEAEMVAARTARREAAAKEVALQDLMTSIGGRFTSRSEEPDA